MKTRFSNIYLLAVLLIVTTFGCSDMETIHEQYLQGEKIYAGKLDSLEVLTGYKRVKIIGLTNFLGNSNECTVTWEGNSRVFPIGAEVGNTFEIIVDSLEERSYEFTLHTTDDMGNQSVSQAATGRAVGDIFKSTQSTRRITEITFEDENTYVNWADQTESEFVLFTQLKYENNNDEMTSVLVSDQEMKTPLENWKPLGKVETLSAAISGELGFDTIYLDPVESQLPPPPFSLLDKSLHSLVWMPSDLPGTTNNEPNQFLFDGRGWIGDFESYHSGDNSGGTPAHITVDLGVKAIVRQVELGFREGFTGNNPVEFELWGIDNITNAETNGSDENEFLDKGWVKLYHSPVDPKLPGVKVELPVGPSVRYIRYRCLGTESGNERAHQLTEMTFWGQDIQQIPLSENAILTVNHENPDGPDAGEGSLKLIDGDLNSKYLIFDYPDKAPLHIQQELPQAEIATRYTLTSANDAPDRDPKNWMILGSNDAQDWTVLDTRNDHAFTDRNQTLSFDIQSDTAYKYYVLAVTANNGGGLFQLSEWTLYK
ncbi:DUF4998 domain-containing protein [Sunxiuqinia sp. sy24]|uniref:DUF4998 domain-containing protein n=1 Tax=Sunxiuqinia sp. sy24 TaxID=3461495 RepID=UPI0040460D4D